MKTLLIYFAVSVCCAFAANAQVAIIVNKSVGVGTLSIAQISAIYSLDAKTWPTGEKVVVYTSWNTTARDKFYDSIQKSDLELKKIWMRVMLSGNGKAPEVLGSDDDVLAKVASTPGAIGYVNAENAKSIVKVVSMIQ